MNATFCGLTEFSGRYKGVMRVRSQEIEIKKQCAFDKDRAANRMSLYH